MQCLLLSHPQTRNSGDYLHRVVWPGEALGEHLSVAAVQTTHPNAIHLAVTAELLVINMVVDPLMLDIIDTRKYKNLKTIYEISDDFCHFPNSLPMHDFYASKSNQDLIKELARSADAVQFSSQYLENKYGYLNPVTKVFRNHLPNLDYRLPKIYPKDKLDIGWAGSVGHYADAKKLVSILKNWPDKDKINVHIMAPDSILELFKNTGIHVEQTPTGDMIDYLNFLKEIDIGIAILENEEFNQGRSDGKYIEYASCGVVPICSNSGAYKNSIIDGTNGFLFDNTDELYKKLNQLIDMPALRNRVREKAWEEVTQTRVHEKAVQSRLKFYSSFIKTYSPKTHSYFDIVVSKKGYTELVDPVEGILLIALEQHIHGDYKTAEELYQMVIQRAPTFYLPWQRISELYQQVNLAEQAESFSNTARRLITPAFSSMAA
ncbi:MAG: glycosyltransferase [Gammaproteobacteria bacterium]|nr:glycosyltransferase [Gammaproteobacteria bacterium]